MLLGGIRRLSGLASRCTQLVLRFVQRMDVYAGGFALAVGLYAGMAWLGGMPRLVDVLPGAPLQLGGALGLMLAGAALLWRRARLPAPSAVRQGLGLVLMLYGLSIQAQTVFDFHSPFDFQALHLGSGSVKMGDGLMSGRMPFALGLGFTLVGMALLLLERHAHRRFLTLVELVAIAPGVVGALALMDHLTAYDDAYVHVYTRDAPMGILAGLTLVAIAAGLWAAAADRRAQALKHDEAEDQRIVRAAAFVMIPVIVLAGFGGFNASRNLVERTMRESLTATLHQNAQFIQSLFDEHLVRVARIVVRPEVVELVDGAARAKAGAAHRAALEREVRALLDMGFTAVRFESAAGAVLAEDGVPALPTGFKTEVHRSPPAQLFWANGFRLRTRAPIMRGERTLGVLQVEQSLPALTALAMGLDATDESSEILIAYRQGDALYNFPSRFSHTPRVEPASAQRLAVYHATTGRTGLLKTRDYRDKEVVAAFTAIGDTDLGLVVKIDVEELYAPIARQFRLWLILLAAGVAAALFILYMLVRPLAQRLMRSEEKARWSSELARAQAEALQHSEARVRAILDSTAEAVLTLGHDRNVLSINPAVERIFGYRAERLIGMPLGALVHTDGDPFSDGVGKPLVGRAFRADGKAIEVEMIIDRVNAGDQAAWVVVARDISERREQERMLRETHARLERGLASLAQRNEEMATLVRMSRVLQRCANETEVYKAVKQFGTLLFRGEAGSLYLQTEHGLQEKAAWHGGVPLGEKEHTCADRVVRPVAEGGCNVRDGLVCRLLSDPYDRRYVTLCIPVTAHERVLGVLLVRSESSPDHEIVEARRHLAIVVAEHIGLAIDDLQLREKLRNESLRDPLTGLYNRRYLEEAYTQAGATAQRQRGSLVVMLIDMDHFKQLNDTLGHEAGDTVLRALGALLQRSVRESDTPCRLGGEEFALLMPAATLEQGKARAEEIRKQIKALRVEHRGRVLDNFSASIGIAAYPDCGRSLAELLIAADQGLYQAKAAGRDCVRVAPCHGIAAQTGGTQAA